MVNYNEFRADAIEQYEKLPDEMNELYKRYYIPIKLPQNNAQKDTTNNENEVKELVKNMENKTRIEFDLIISKSYIKNNSKIIQIKKMKELSDKELEEKIFKNKDNKLGAFLNAYSENLFVCKIGPTSHDKINILFINDSDNMTQLHFDLSENSNLNVSEFFVSCCENESIEAVLHEFNVRKGSSLEINLINNCSSKTTFLNLSKGVAEGGGKINANFVYNGSKMTKSINYFDALGVESNIDVNEVVYGGFEQKFDINTYLINAKERTKTHLETGVVLDGESRCVLKGYAKVNKYTKGAISRVNERGIIISEKAHIDALPDMSIDYSDEVSATHSAATSPIDKEALFYIISRGIDEKQARKMFISSFINKYLFNIKDSSAKEIASSILLSRLDNDKYGVIEDITTKGIWLSATKGE
ncbi:MAG: SufB/SufD family protein [Candidatus Micrarchaeia archaeon]